MNVIDKRG